MPRTLPAVSLGNKHTLCSLVFGGKEGGLEETRQYRDLPILIDIT